MQTNETLVDKINEFNKLVDRRKKINSFFYRLRSYEMAITIDGTKYRIEYQDKELEKLIDDYYKKQLEEVDKRLNELLK